MQVSVGKIQTKEKQNREPVLNAYHFTNTKAINNSNTNIHIYIHNIPQPTKVRQREGNVHKWRDHARNRSPEETIRVQNKEMSMYPNESLGSLGGTFLLRNMKCIQMGNEVKLEM